MAEPTNPNQGPPPAGDERRPVEHQETLLLTDVPEVSGMVPDQPPPAESNSTLSPATLAALSKRYDILAEAGHGSMGNVYKARDRETGEIVALKLLKPEIASDQTMMERFKNELLFARKITHKNVCRVHEFNRIGGIAYTSMELDSAGGCGSGTMPETSGTSVSSRVSWCSTVRRSSPGGGGPGFGLVGSALFLLL